MSVGTMKDGNYLEVAPGTSSPQQAELLARVAALENEVSTLKAQKASTQQFGLAKISGDTDVSETDSGLVLGAWEKNEENEGGLANRIKKLVSNQNKIEIVTGSLKNFLKNNIENNKFIIAAFYDLVDSPFQNIQAGYLIGAFSSQISPNVFLLAFSYSSVEASFISMT